MPNSPLSQQQRDTLVEEARRWLRWADIEPSQRQGYPQQAGVGRGGIEQVLGELTDPAGVAHGGVGHAGLEGAVDALTENQTHVVGTDSADHIRQFAARVLSILGAGFEEGTTGKPRDQI